jgi:hypothetical protein
MAITKTSNNNLDFRIQFQKTSEWPHKQCCESVSGGSLIKWPPESGSLLFVKDSKEFRKYINVSNTVIPGLYCTVLILLFENICFQWPQKCPGRIQNYGCADPDPEEISTDPQNCVLDSVGIGNTNTVSIP